MINEWDTRRSRQRAFNGKDIQKRQRYISYKETVMPRKDGKDKGRQVTKRQGYLGKRAKDDG